MINSQEKSKWKETALGEIAEIVKDAWKPNDEQRSYIGLEHINEQDLTLNSVGSSEGLESNKFRFKAGDILFGKLRPYFRKVAVPSFDGICSTDIWVIRAKQDNDQKFLFYFMANPVLIDKSMGASTGSRMPRADWNFLSETQWSVPEQTEQRAIGAVLSSFDDKIELLRNQNKTLEAIAQQLFHEWFVEFNFPNANGEPYKKNGGKMVDGELGKMPEGWRVGGFADEVEIVMGQSPSGLTYNESGKGIVFFQGRAEFQERFPQTRLYTTEPKKIAEKFDVLLSVRAPVGDINVACERCCIGRGLAAIRGTFMSYTLHKTKHLKSEFNKYNAEGTVFGAINKTSIENIKVFIPSHSVVEAFEKVVSCIDQKFYKNFLQMQNLISLREALLPRMMTGEVRVRMS